MSRILSPPPDPRDNRAFRDWLFKVYAVINGLDPASAMMGEDTSGSPSAIASLSGAVFSGQQASELSQLRNQVGEIQKAVDRLSLLFTAQIAKPDQLQPILLAAQTEIGAKPDQLQPILLAAQTEIGALRKRIDEVMIWR